jgi:hypothetical protein
LTIADVQSVTGVKGLKLVPKNPAKGAGGDLNFLKPDGSLLVMAVLGPATLIKQWKAQPRFAGSAVTGDGDEAFADPPAPRLTSSSCARATTLRQSPAFSGRT